MLSQKEITYIAHKIQGYACVKQLAKIEPTLNILPGMKTAEAISGALGLALHHLLADGAIDPEDLILSLVDAGANEENAREYVEFVKAGPSAMKMEEPDAT